MASQEKPSKGRYAEDINAPIIYADAIWSVGQMAGDNLTLTFAAKTLDHSAEPPATVMKTVLRVVIPRSQLKEAAEFLAAYITRPPAQPEIVIPLRAMN